MHALQSVWCLVGPGLILAPQSTHLAFRQNFQVPEAYSPRLPHPPWQAGPLVFGYFFLISSIPLHLLPVTFPTGRGKGNGYRDGEEHESCDEYDRTRDESHVSPTRHERTSR
jgi:hypothetical protein